MLIFMKGTKLTFIFVVVVLVIVVVILRLFLTLWITFVIFFHSVSFIIFYFVPHIVVDSKNTDMDEKFL